MSAGKGMTLLEIMIAIAVLGVAMLATFLAVTQGEHLATLSDEESLAQQAAERVIANLRAGDFSDLGQFSSLDELVGKDLHFTPCTAEGTGFVLHPHVDSQGAEQPMGSVSVVQDGNLLSVEVTVRWRGDTPEAPHTLTMAMKARQ